jgi:hypothetical protein
MNTLIIQGTEFTPGIDFNPENRKLEFQGVSRPENVSEFYTPVIEWITDYESDLYKINVSGGSKFLLDIVFRLSYFNSASAKMIFTILESIARIRNMGFPVNIDWYYDEGDDQMCEDGQELSDAIDIPFNFHTNS